VGDETQARYWIEVTDRVDLGADLHAPQTNENGQAYWSYSLINEIASGDIVFHYHKPRSAIVAASRADGQVVAGEMVWAARGPSARGRGIQPHSRPGWYMGLSAFSELPRPVTLDELEEQKDRIRSTLAAIRSTDPERARYFPFELSDKRAARPLQGYLFRMPVEFLRVFPELSQVVNTRTELVYGAHSRPKLPIKERRTPFGSKPLGQDYVLANGGVTIEGGDVFERDPEALERQLRIHAETQNGLARAVCEKGFLPRSPRPDEPCFDLAWEEKTRLCLAEVKSLRDQNEDKQLRLGIGQLVHYRAWLAAGGQTVASFLVTDRKPRDPDWSSVCEGVGIKLVWPDVFNQIWD
jgi:hypothetical protein